MLHDQFPSDAPDLYHYSTSAGLLGIVNYGQLWLSNVSFLNDAQEYLYGINLIREVMQAEYAPLFHVPITAGDVAPIFSMSLTQRGDLLSQWRGYCPNGGYSFAFDKQQLNAVLSTENARSPTSILKVGKCIYNKDKQVEYIRERLEQLMPSPDRRSSYLAWDKEYNIERQFYGLKDKASIEPLSEQEQEKLQELEALVARREHSEILSDRSRSRHLVSDKDALMGSLPEVATLLKHPTFREEKEWRIIYRSMDLSIINKLRSPLSDDEVEFREGKSTLIPYIKIPLATTDNPVRITKVFVSPGPQQKLAKAACQAYLERNGSAAAIVKKSKIPYRNW